MYCVHIRRGLFLHFYFILLIYEPCTYNQLRGVFSIFRLLRIVFNVQLLIIIHKFQVINYCFEPTICNQPGPSRDSERQREVLVLFNILDFEIHKTPFLNLFKLKRDWNLNNPFFLSFCKNNIYDTLQLFTLLKPKWLCLGIFHVLNDVDCLKVHKNLSSQDFPSDLLIRL